MVYGLAHRRVAHGRLPWRAAVAPTGVAVLLLALGAWPTTWLQAVAVGSAGLVLFALYAWACLLHPHERRRLLEIRPMGFWA